MAMNRPRQIYLPLKSSCRRKNCPKRGGLKTGQYKKELFRLFVWTLKFLQKLIASWRQQRIICIPFLTKVNENCH
jgi:hypothetical protein